MSDRRPAPETIRELARRVATTDHAALDDDTVDHAVDLATTIDEDIGGPETPSAVEDLLLFWDTYILAGLEDAVSDVGEYEQTTTFRERVERGNTADLYGLDIYQALLEVAETSDIEGTDDDRAVAWATRLSELTGDFVAHLEDHT